MPYAVYKMIHFLGIFMLLMTLAVSCMPALTGGAPASRSYRRRLGAVHGVAAFLALLGGFGMLARLGIAQDGLPVWIYLKLAIWLILGAALVLAYRGARGARIVLVGAPLFAVLAAAIALHKPF